MAAASRDEEVVVLSHRRHHHVFDPKDKRVTFIDWARPVGAENSLLHSVFEFTVGAIMVHYFLWIIPMVGTLWFFYSIGWWPVSLGLLAWYIPTFFNRDHLKSGRPWHWLRKHWFWHHVNRWAGLEVVRLGPPLDPSRQFIFASYPHGILILSRLASYGGQFEMLFPGIETRVLGASPMFYLPGSRELCLWMTAVDAAKRVAVNILNKYKLNLMVFPGGSDEIFLTDPKSPVTTLVARKGFIRLALQTGADIVPTVVLGEKWLYTRQTLPKLVQKFFMRTMRMPLILFWGALGTWVPKTDEQRAFLTVVYGRPIRVAAPVENPTEEQVEAVWVQYKAAIETTFNTMKDKVGYGPEETLAWKEAVSHRAPDVAAQHHHHDAAKNQHRD